MRVSAEGVRIEASVLARLLGIKLLKLDATVLVLPNEVSAAAPNPVIRASPANRLPKAKVAPRGDDRRLADAVRKLDEGARLLDEARRDGATH